MLDTTSNIIAGFVHDGMPNAMDILPSRRASDYSFDVYLNGLWVASAKNYAAADDAAIAIWQATKARIVTDALARIATWSAPLDVEFAPVGWAASKRSARAFQYTRGRA